MAELSVSDVYFVTFVVVVVLVASITQIVQLLKSTFDNLSTMSFTALCGNIDEICGALRGLVPFAKFKKHENTR